MVIINNGDVVEVSEQGIRIAGQVPSGVELVDSSRDGIVHRTVLRERQQLAEDGMITVAALANSHGRLLSKPTVHLRGVVTDKTPEQWERQIHRVLEEGIKARWKEVVEPGARGELPTVNWSGLESRLEEEVRRFIRRELPKRYPLIVFLLQTIDAPVTSSDLTLPPVAAAVS
jgi:ribonuclease J